MRIGTIQAGFSPIRPDKNININCKNKNINAKSNNSFVSFSASTPLEGLHHRMKIELTNMLYGHRPFGFHSPDGYIEVLKQFEVSNLITLQGESAVFAMKDPNLILKISCSPYEEYIPEFHAPEQVRGTIVTDKKYPIINLMGNIETDKFYWVIQKKGKMPVSAADQNSLIQRVLEAGYKLRDIKYDQFAYFDGEAKFIDLGCICKDNNTDYFHNNLIKGQLV